MRQYDAVIIGGGPAGALTAGRLARAGWRIALIEKGPRHRNKTCGHCLQARSFPWLAEAGVLDEIKSQAAATISKFHVYHRSGRAMQTAFAGSDGGGAGLVISRRQLDQHLIDRAAADGALVFQPATARADFHRATTEIHLQHAATKLVLQTGLVIGADGIGSGVARAAGLTNHASAGRSYGCSFAIHAPDSHAIAPDTVAMFITAGGYLGAVHQGDGRFHIAARIGAGSTSERRNPFQFIRRVAREHALLQSLGLHGAAPTDFQDFSAVGPIPWRPSNLANHRAALVGDAAGYIEPFTGEGMTWAFLSADVLCSVLESSRPGQWNGQLARQYAHEWKRRVAPRHWLCRALAAALNHPPLTDACFTAARCCPALTDRVVRMVVAA